MTFMVTPRDVVAGVVGAIFLLLVIALGIESWWVKRRRRKASTNKVG